MTDTLFPETGSKLDNTKWRLTLSFGPSSSVNYLRAVQLAKLSFEYLETVDDNGKPIHQASFTDSAR